MGKTCPWQGLGGAPAQPLHILAGGGPGLAEPALAGPLIRGVDGPQMLTVGQPDAAQPQHRLVQGAIQGGSLPPAVIPGGAVHGEQQACRLAGEQLLRVRLPRLVAKGETRQQGAIQQPLEPGWQVAPPDGQGGIALC